MTKGEKAPAKRKSGGLLIHTVILLLLAVLGWQLYSLRSQIADAQTVKDRTARQVETMTRSNETLKADIDEGVTDEKMKELARDELGWTDPDEYVFYDKSN